MSAARLVLFSFVALAGCSGQTQLVVVVDTNLDVPDEIDNVEVVVTGPSGVRTVAPQSLVGADVPDFPLTLGVTPGGDALGPVDVIAVGTLDGVEVVRTAARVTLVAGETRTITLVLLRGCVGRDCGGDRTCGPDGCLSPDDVTLAPWTGEPEPFSDPDPCLALPWDVDGDGDGSEACGGDDCDDDEPRSYGGAVEDCDGVDNNCDGRVDEDCDCTPVAAVEPCVNECGSTGQRVCEETGWSACALLTETCNGDDDDCDGRTDEGFDYVPSAEVMVSPAGFATTAPRVLSVGDGWSLVWSSTGGDDETPAGIHFAALDATGAVLTPTTNVAGTGTAPDFAWSGSAYGLSWARRDSRSDCCAADCTTQCTFYNDRIFTLVFGPDGAPLTTTEEINSDADTIPRVRVVWDGEAFSTSHADGTLQFYRFGEDNVSVFDIGAIPSPNAAAADLSWDGTQFAFAYARQRDVYFLRGSLMSLPSPEQLVATTTEEARHASLARTTTGYLEAWLYEAEIGTIFDKPVVLGGIALDAAGAPLGEPFVISSTIGEENILNTTADPPSLVGAGAQVLVTWVDERDLDPEVYFARLAPDGFVIQAPTRVTTATGQARTTSAAQGPDGFGVTWTDEREASTARAVYFARIACPPPPAP